MFIHRAFAYCKDVCGYKQYMLARILLPLLPHDNMTIIRCRESRKVVGYVQKFFMYRSSKGIDFMSKV
jgi:hypothetical protein